MMIRQASPADVDGVMTVYQAVYGSNESLGLEPYPEPEFFDRAALVALLARETLFIAVIDHAVVGCVAVYWDLYHSAPAVLDDLVVSPDYRNRAIAQHLVQHAVGYLDDQGSVLATVQTITSQPYSQRVFFNNGFTQVVGLDLCRYPQVYRLGIYESSFIQRRVNPSLAEREVAMTPVFVPHRYKNVVEAIMASGPSFISPAVQTATNGNQLSALRYRAEQQSHGWVAEVYESNSESCNGRALVAELFESLSIAMAHQDYVQVKLPANQGECIDLANQLMEMGFLFHSFLCSVNPLGVSTGERDILTMQWVNPCRFPDHGSGSGESSDLDWIPVSSNPKHDGFRAIVELIDKECSLSIGVSLNRLYVQ